MFWHTIDVIITESTTEQTRWWWHL